MGCGCNKNSSEVKFRLVQKDGTAETFDTRSEASAVQQSRGGKIRPVRIPPGQDPASATPPPPPPLPSSDPALTR